MIGTLILSPLLMVAVGMWCGDPRSRRVGRVSVGGPLLLGWVAVCAAASTHGDAQYAWVATAAVAALVGAHLIAFIIGDAASTSWAHLMRVARLPEMP